MAVLVVQGLYTFLSKEGFEEAKGKKVRSKRVYRKL